MLPRVPDAKPRLIPDLVAGGAVLVAHTLIWRLWLDLPTAHTAASVLAYGALSLVVWAAAPAGLPGPGAGWANRVTLLRAALVLPVAALLVTPASVGGSTAWSAVSVATLALALDGVDGAVARRTGTTSRFGARFDMELDAFLILALALLVWRATPLGPWVVWIGLIRYAFVLVGWAWTPLRADLPESLRRKVVCVVQVAGLLVALAPVTGPAMDLTVCAIALALLVYSFAVDVLWLVRRTREHAPASAR